MAKFIVGNLKEELEADDDIQKILGQFAQEALPIAQSGASRIADTGAFRDSLSVNGNRLESDDPGGAAIEYGSVDTPVHAVLRSAAEAVGGKVVER